MTTITMEVADRRGLEDPENDNLAKAVRSCLQFIRPISCSVPERSSSFRNPVRARQDCSISSGAWAGHRWNSGFSRHRDRRERWLWRNVSRDRLRTCTCAGSLSQIEI